MIDWTELTAIGTLALSVSTFYLAVETRATARAAKDDLAAANEQTKAVVEQAEATTRQVGLLEQSVSVAGRQSDVAEQALSASIRPLLVNVPVGAVGPRRDGYTLRLDGGASAITWTPTATEALLTVPVRNVGAGVARIDAAALTYADAVGAVTHGRVPAVVAVGGMDVIEFSSTADPEPGLLARLVACGEELLLEVRYSDVAGAVTATRIRMLKEPDAPEFRVTKVDPLVEPRLFQD